MSNGTEPLLELNKFLPIGGIWAYTLQGVMHAQNIELTANSPLIPPYIVPDPPRKHVVKRAYPSTERVEKPSKAHPALTAYFPPRHAHPRGAAPAPAQPPAIPLNPAFGPQLTEPPFSVSMGYYPFSESGFMAIDSRTGRVAGEIWINTAGYTGPERATFTGRVRLDVGMTGVVQGIISIVFGNHMWDYSFVKISIDEIHIASLGRLPRPAVGTGSMRLIGELPKYLKVKPPK